MERGGCRREAGGRARQIRRLTRALSDKNEELARHNRKLQEEIALRKLLRGQLSHISDQEARRWGLEGFVAESPSMQRILEEVGELQQNEARAVLLLGEPGTGKEMLARAIHYGSARSSGPFVTLNCTDLPQDVVLSLDSRSRALSALFGHVSGTFGGAESDQDGCFQMADGGTLFLDEIGRMPVSVQGSLLRALHSGEAKRMGEAESRTVDVRIIASTSVPLQRLVEEKVIAADLYQYLAGLTVELPALRQRPEDIRPLAQHFLRLLMKEMGRELPELDGDVLELLEAYSFPGNVRELKNAMERALLESGGHEIGREHIRFLGPAASPTPRSG